MSFSPAAHRADQNLEACVEDERPVFFPFFFSEPLKSKVEKWKMALSDFTVQVMYSQSILSSVFEILLNKSRIVVIHINLSL